MAIMAEFCLLKPVCGEFVPAIGHVFATENSHLQHLFWRQVRSEIGIEAFPDRLCGIIEVILLHKIINYYFLLRHQLSSSDLVIGLV